MERHLIEGCGHEIKESDDNVWSATPKSDVEGSYIKMKKVGRGLMSVKHCVKEEENS